MSAQSHYDIAVCQRLDGGKFELIFRTSTALWQGDAVRLRNLLREKFPADKYEVSMVYWNSTGYSTDEEGEEER